MKNYIITALDDNKIISIVFDGEHSIQTNRLIDPLINDDNHIVVARGTTEQKLIINLANVRFIRISD